MERQCQLMLAPLTSGEVTGIIVTIERDEQSAKEKERYLMLMQAHQQLVVMALAAEYQVRQYYRPDGTYVTEIRLRNTPWPAQRRLEVQE